MGDDAITRDGPEYRDAAASRHYHPPDFSTRDRTSSSSTWAFNSGVAEHPGLEPLIAEGAARVKPLHQAHEVAMPLVERGDRRRVRMKELAPVRAGMERASVSSISAAMRSTASCSRFQVKWIATQSLPVGRAHPQLVGSDGADLGDLQERLDAARGAPAWLR